MNISNKWHDPFCEKIFWSEINVQTSVSDPICTVTGIIMGIIALIFPILQFSNQFDIQSFDFTFLYLCKGILITLSVATSFYHGIYYQNSMNNLLINDHMVDWLSMIFMIWILCIYYIKVCFITKNIVNNETFLTFIFFCTSLLMLALGVGMDSHTEKHLRTNSDDVTKDRGQDTYGTILNACLLFLPAVLFAYISIYHLKHTETKRVYLLLFISLGFWIINVIFCEGHPWMFIFHACYHIFIFLFLLILTCIAARIEYDNYLKIHFKFYFWPILLKKSFF